MSASTRYGSLGTGLSTPLALFDSGCLYPQPGSLLGPSSPAVACSLGDAAQVVSFVMLVLGRSLPLPGVHGGVWLVCAGAGRGAGRREGRCWRGSRAVLGSRWSGLATMLSAGRQQFCAPGAVPGQPAHVSRRLHEVTALTFPPEGLPWSHGRFRGCGL